VAEGVAEVDFLLMLYSMLSLSDTGFSSTSEDSHTELLLCLPSHALLL